MVTRPKAMAARRRLGVELRALREEAGFSGEQAAAHFGWSQAKISRMEAAVNRPTVHDVHDLLELYRAGAAVRDELLSLAATAATREATWWNDYAGTVSVRSRQRTALEADATRILHFQPNVLPGLFQTPEYARAVFTVTGVEMARENIDLAVAFRAIRKEFVMQSSPEYQVLVTDTALRWCPGSTDVQLNQLRALLKEVHHGSKVTIRVILDYPRDGVLPQPDFTIYEFSDSNVPAVAYVEVPTGYFDADKPREILYYQKVFKVLHESALDPGESVRHIERVIEELEKR